MKDRLGHTLAVFETLGLWRGERLVATRGKGKNAVCASLRRKELE